MIIGGLSTPVVLLAFNRPECAARVLDTIRPAQPTRLWVIGDGPRLDRPNDLEKVTAVRALIDSGVDWPCEVRRVYADTNLGCARRVSSGLNSVFAEETEAIILEDDCVPDPTFFPFCAELLQRYRDDHRVGAISGDNFQQPGWTCPHSYYFSRYPHCWGWATWRRAWSLYDHSMKAWRLLRTGPWLSSHTTCRGEERYWRQAFDFTLADKLDSWAYRWTFACWQHNLSAILPQKNLVSNIGFGAAATHTHDSLDLANMSTTPVVFPMSHPDRLSVDSNADRATAIRNYHMPGVWTRILRKVNRFRRGPFRLPTDMRPQ